MPRSSQNPTPAPPGHIWIEEASRLTGLSKKTLYNLRYKGEGPACYPIGRKLAFPLDGANNIHAWFEALTNPAPDTDTAHDSRPPEPRRLRASRPSQHPVKAAA